LAKERLSKPVVSLIPILGDGGSGDKGKNINLKRTFNNESINTPVEMMTKSTNLIT
jgi:hypothetical protein